MKEKTLHFVLSNSCTNVDIAYSNKREQCRDAIHDYVSVLERVNAIVIYLETNVSIIDIFSPISDLVDHILSDQWIAHPMTDIDDLFVVLSDILSSITFDGHSNDRISLD